MRCILTLHMAKGISSPTGSWPDDSCPSFPLDDAFQAAMLADSVGLHGWGNLLLETV